MPGMLPEWNKSCSIVQTRETKNVPMWRVEETNLVILSWSLTIYSEKDQIQFLT